MKRAFLKRKKLRIFFFFEGLCGLGNRCFDMRRYLPSRETLISLGLGQFLSLLITGTGVSSALLAGRGVNIPTTQSLLNYALLCLYLIPLLLRHGRHHFLHLLRSTWWQFLLLAACDVEANFLVVLAYQYTSLSSVMLLDCFSIPCVMILARVFLKRPISFPHLLGVILCVLGVAALFLSDALEGSFRGPPSPRPALGDGLCVAAAVLYACSNVGQEAQVIERSAIEYLAMLGMFALPLSAVQSAVLEHSQWTQMQWNAENVLLLISYAACLFALYSLVPTLLQRAGATFLNVSLLTSDVLAVVIGIFLFSYLPSWFYLLGAALIIAGLIVYNLEFKYCCCNKSEEKTSLVAPSDSETTINDAEHVDIIAKEMAD